MNTLEIPELEFIIDLQGESLYTKWLALGNVGTWTDFLEWLKIKGDTGFSAYEIWINLGNVGTETDFMTWLQTPAYEAGITAVEAKDIAVSAKNTAVAAKDTAVASATASQASEEGAIAAKLQAEAAATAAQNSEQDADLSEAAAQNAKIEAEVARDASVTAMNTATTQAGIATTQAEIATTKAGEASVSATNAQTSETNAGAAATNAVAAKDAAVIAKTAAEAAKTEAQTANTAAQSAKTAAETANTNAQAAKTSAETAATTATTKAGEASASANALATGYKLIPFMSRVVADGGTTRDLTITEKLFRENLQLLGNTVLLINGNTVKTRTSGSNVFVTKAYDNSTNNNDTVQATEANQPFYAGNIAANEVGKLKTMLDTSNVKMGFLQQSFASSQPWSATVVFSQNSKRDEFSVLLGNATGGHSTIHTYANNIGFRNSLATVTDFLGAHPYSKKGKQTIITLISRGDGTLSLHVDGVYIGTNSIITSVDFSALLSSPTNTTRCFNGTLSHAQIFNKALSAYEVQQHHTYLRSIYPEIEGVAIGNQYIATSNYEGGVAGDGSVIPEVQASDNSDKVVNGNFEGTKVHADNGNHTSAIVYDAAKGSNVLEITSTGVGSVNADRCLWINGAGLTSDLNTLSGYGVKISFDAISISGNSTLRIDDTALGVGSISSKTITTSWNAYSYFYKKGSTGGAFAAFLANVGVVRIDNLKFEVIGWSQAQALYDGIYAQTTGTAAVKDLAATKAASMWSFYNNDPLNGAIYGKLYNWWAVKLISLYPPKGWRVPSSSDWAQLRAYLGGNSIAGGKMKLEGEVYWGVPNVSATNESGFSGIGGGYRIHTTGLFADLKQNLILGASDEASATNQWDLYISRSGIVFGAGSTGKRQGCSIRLMRNEPVGPNERMETTGLFTTDITSTAKQLPIPFGYVVRTLRITSGQALTGVEVKLHNVAGTAIATLITGKSISAGTTMIYGITAEHAAMLQDATVRMTASGNSGSTTGIELQAVLDKATF